MGARGFVKLHFCSFFRMDLCGQSINFASHRIVWRSVLGSNNTLCAQEIATANAPSWIFEKGLIQAQNSPKTRKSSLICGNGGRPHRVVIYALEPGHLKRTVLSARKATNHPRGGQSQRVSRCSSGAHGSKTPAHMVVLTPKQYLPPAVMHSATRSGDPPVKPGYWFRI